MSGPYEPPIVGVLRRYVRRGAPMSLVARIAGGTRCWRQLNDAWGIDGLGLGRAETRLEARPAEPLEGLSFAERRIAILQLAEEHEARDEPFPVLKILAGYFGVERERIATDIFALRKEGRLAWKVSGDAASGSRRIPQRVAP